MLHQEELNKLLTFLVNSAIIKDKNNDDASNPITYLAKRGYWEWVCSVENCLEETTPELSHQIERTIATHSMNIYDAAMWSVVMAIAGKFNLAGNPSKLLKSGRLPDANPNSNIRAVSDPNKLPTETFTYGINNTYINSSENAFLYRTIPPAFINVDPLSGHRGIPANTTSEWQDWKAITGENAWVYI